jgi:hypothetical protein
MSDLSTLNSQLSTDLPPGITAEDLARHEARIAGIQRARVAPLPGPLKDAFAPEPITAAGLPLRPMTLGDQITLTQIGSILLEIRAEMATLADSGLELQAIGAELSKRLEQPKEGQTAAARQAQITQSAIETVFLFTVPPPEGRKLLAKGLPAFREAAMAAVGDRLNEGQAEELLFALGKLLSQAIVTQVSYAAEKAADGSFPLATSPTATGSAGGSTSLAR